jgi:hypothetical protein
MGIEDRIRRLEEMLGDDGRPYRGDSSAKRLGECPWESSIPPSPPRPTRRKD